MIAQPQHFITGRQQLQQLHGQQLEITAVWEFITPDLATEYLAMNTHNRSLRTRHVMALARDMKAGAWRRNGETIKFDVAEELADGQHRLAGIIVADIGQWMLVIRGLPVDAQETIDAGIKRTVSDVLMLRGETNYTTLSTIARAVTLYERGARGAGNFLAVTTAETLQTLTQYPWLRDGCTIVAGIARHGLLPRGIGGALWFATQQVDPVDSDFFFERLNAETQHEPTDPIYALRTQLLRANAARGTRSGRWMLGLSIKAWNKYRRGEQVGAFRFVEGGANAETFPELV